MTDIFEGQPHFDMREKHAVKLKDAALAKMAELMDKSGIDLDEFIEYYDSDRVTVSEQVQMHRRKFANIRKSQEGLVRYQEEKRAAKQTQTERGTGEGTKRNQEVGTGAPKAPDKRQQTATARDGFIKATNSG